MADQEAGAEDTPTRLNMGLPRRTRRRLDVYRKRRDMGLAVAVRILLEEILDHHAIPETEEETDPRA